MDAGTKAIPMLIAHVKDDTLASLIVGGATKTPPTVGEACFSILHLQVEGKRPKYYRRFDVLSQDNVAQWWETRKSKSLHELRLEAAQMSLDSARKALAAEGPKSVKEAVEFLERHLHEVENE